MSELENPGIAGSAEHPALLPWYVEGNLDPESKREVESHLGQCAECRSEVEALASMRVSLRVAHSGPGRPIPLEDLLAYENEGRPLTPTERQGLEKHLAACPECSEDLAALRESRKGDVARRGPETPPWTRPARAPGKRAAWMAAAALLVLAAGLSAVWLTWPTRRADITLLPAQRGSEEAPVLLGGGPWTITVILPFGATPGTYSVLVETEARVAIVGAGSSVASGSEGSLSVPLASLPGPGLYRLVVRSESGAAAGPLEYPFRYETAAEPIP